MTTLKARRCPCGNAFVPKASRDTHCPACWHAIGLDGSPYCAGDGTCCGECDEGPPWAADDPLVKGGQGRTGAALDRAATVCAWVAGLTFGLGTIALLWWLTLKAAGVK